MYNTVIDIYKDFLKEIKKSNIASVPPSIFNIIINDGYTLWYRNKSEEIELDQKKQDDLKELMVITDGVYIFEGSPLIPLVPISNGSNIFPLPKSNDNSYSVSILGTFYPNYRRLLNVEFKYVYNGDPCYPDGDISPWISGKPLRTNQKNVIKKNPFRKPNTKNLYYQLRGNMVELLLDENSTNIPHSMKIEYIKYPRLINYDPVIPGNNVMCELQSDQIREIIEISARTYLQEATDPRYQTKLNEMVLGQKGK
jgi:hypothetical protein